MGKCPKCNSETTILKKKITKKGFKKCIHYLLY